MRTVKKYGADVLNDISAVYDRLSIMRRERLEPFKISDWDAAVLIALYNAPKVGDKRARGISVSDLRAEMGASISYVSRALSRLMSRGILQQTTDPGDRRYKYITATGQVDPEEIYKADKALETDLLGSLTPDEVAELSRLLGKIHGI